MASNRNGMEWSRRNSPVQVEGGNLGVVALIVREVEVVGQRLLLPRKPVEMQIANERDQRWGCDIMKWIETAGFCHQLNAFAWGHFEFSHVEPALLRAMCQLNYLHERECYLKTKKKKNEMFLYIYLKKKKRRAEKEKGFHLNCKWMAL